MEMNGFVFMDFKVICVVPMPWIGNLLAIPPRKHVGDGVVNGEVKKFLE